MPGTTENKLDFSWERFTEKDFNDKKNDLLNGRDWSGPALIDVGAVNIELHDPEYSSAGGEPRVFLDYYIGGDTSDNPYSDNLQNIPYGHADGDSIPISAMLSSTYEEFKKYLEDEVSTELTRSYNLKVLQEAQRPTVNFDDPRQGAELYITKLAEKVDLAEQKDRRTWQFVRDNHPGYHDDLTIGSDQIFSDNDVYRSVVAGEMSVEAAEKFVDLRGTKADFAREFIKTEKEILDDAIDNWQPEEADENGNPVEYVPDYVQEFRDVVKDVYDEMDRAVDIINFENEKDKFVKSLSGWEHNTDLDVDGKMYDQYFIYPTESLEGIGQEFDKDGKPTTSLRLVVDIDQETNEIDGGIQIDRLNDVTGDVDANNVESELTMHGHKILNSAKKEIRKYLMDELKRVDKEWNLDKMFDGKYSIDDGNNRMTFRETLDFYNKEDDDRPYEERLNHAVSRMLYCNLDLPDDEAGEKKWKICDTTAKDIVRDGSYDSPDDLKKLQIFADEYAKEEFGYSRTEQIEAFKKLFAGEMVETVDGDMVDFAGMKDYYDKSEVYQNYGFSSKLEMAVSRMLMFTIKDFASLEPEKYDDITHDGAAAEKRYELCDRISSELVGGKIISDWNNPKWDEIQKEIAAVSSEIADREIGQLRKIGAFVQADKSAEKAAMDRKTDFYFSSLSPEEQKKFNSFIAVGPAVDEDAERLRTVLSLYVPNSSAKGKLSEKESSLIAKYLFKEEENGVAWLRSDRSTGALYLQRYLDGGDSKFTRTSLKGIMELAVENAEKAEDAGAALTLQEWLNELRGFSQNVQKSDVENSTKKQTIVQQEPAKEDIFGDFVSKVDSEYKDLKLILRSAANVLKQLSSEQKKEVRNELLKRGAKTPESLAIVMRNAIREKQHIKTQKPESLKKSRDYGMER